MSGQSEKGFECPDFIKRNSGKADGLPPEEGDRQYKPDAESIFYKDGISRQNRVQA